MTTTGAVSQLEYATPMPAGRSNGMLRILVALTVALLAADSFALAAGFDPVGNIEQEPMPLIGRVVCGAVIFALVLAAAGPVGRLLRGVGPWQAAGGTRGRAARLALLICGTVCILAALAVEVYLVRYGQTLVSGRVGNGNGGPGPVVMSVKPPVFGRILAGAAFVVGVMLVGSGASGEPARRRDAESAE